MSFGVRHPRGLLHANFVVAVLSDLFGIQARSGCFCAGPYLHRAYPVDDAWSAAMARAGPAWAGTARRSRSRASASTTSSARRSFDYIVDAVHLIANDGWKLLPLYRFDPDTRPLAPRGRAAREPLLSLARRRVRRGRAGALATAPERALAGQLDEARRIIRASRGAAPPADPALPPEFERIRWFPLPGECGPA